MADWNFIEDSEIDAGSPMNTTLFSRLARNPQAIAEGAEGAPPVLKEALGDVAAGAVAQQVLRGSRAFSGSAYSFLRSFICLQAGSLRVSFGTSGGAYGRDARLYVDGVLVTSGDSITVDITVDHGSEVRILGRGASGTSTTTAYLGDVTISTDGALSFFPVIPSD